MPNRLYQLSQPEGQQQKVARRVWIRPNQILFRRQDKRELVRHQGGGKYPVQVHNEPSEHADHVRHRGSGSVRAR